eukprot:3566797-Pyramimonas_sp.AAC.1
MRDSRRQGAQSCRCHVFGPASSCSLRTSWCSRRWTWSARSIASARLQGHMINLSCLAADPSTGAWARCHGRRLDQPTL